MGTRVALGAGIGLFVSSRLHNDQRKTGRLALIQDVRDYFGNSLLLCITFRVACAKLRVRFIPAM